MDFGGHRTKTRGPAHPLLQARGGPRKVEMHHNGRILKIHAFAEQVRAQEQVNPLRSSRLGAPMRSRGEASQCLRTCQLTARYMCAGSGERAYAIFA
jgi:hypothetical protein